VALLTRLLLSQGVLDYAGVEEGIKAQVVYGGRIGTNLLDMGLVTEEQLCKALEKCYGVPSVMIDSDGVDLNALHAIPEKFIRRYRVLPFWRRRMAIGLAMDDPDKKSIVADISYSTGFIIKPHVMPEHRLDRLLEHFFEIPARWRYTESYEEEVAPEDIQFALKQPVERLDARQAAEKLLQARRGREIPNIILGYAKNFFSRAALLVVRRREMLGLTGFSPQVDGEFFEGIQFTVEPRSVFEGVVESGMTYRGPLAKEGVGQAVVEMLGSGMPRSAFAAPVNLRGRVVNVLYGDAGPGRDIPGGLDEMVLLLNLASQAYERLVRERLEVSLKEN
jgi:hypothetical protein